jgi:D-alanyl-D-alanine carboxypeptidase/D-alanyl-D-alanine-endopeptidase (penicillin-binding protein 4)
MVDMDLLSNRFYRCVKFYPTLRAAAEFLQSMIGIPKVVPGALGLVLLLTGCAVSDGRLAPRPEAGPVAASAGSSLARPADADPAVAPADIQPVAPDEIIVAAAGSGIEIGPRVRTPDPLAMTASPSGATRRTHGTELGYLLLDLESGQPLAEMNPDLPLIPASTAKLATAVIALDVLGGEHRYRTDLLVTGPISDGVLEGDLVLRGGGDPSLDVGDLLDLVMQLRKGGIERVAGRFMMDDAALPRLREIDPGQPLEAAYNPGIGALSLAFNRVRVAWRGGPGGGSATIPPLEEAHFELAPADGLPPSGIELKSDGDAVVWQVADRGRRQMASLPVKDAGLHAARVFRWLAGGHGIDLPPPQRTWQTPFEAQLIGVHESAPLRILLRDMLVYSNNMMAEMIGLSAVQHRHGVESLDQAGDVLLAELRRLIPEIDWRAASLGNHSGLDARARLTPRQLAAIVRYGWRTGTLPALLPAGGWSGTLARRFDDPDQALRVWAKTGTLNYGSALAGYLLRSGGHPAIFVSMVSDIDARAAYDRLERPSPREEGEARRWNSRAVAVQDDLVEGWLAPLADS